jgi:hypothetical protein
MTKISKAAKQAAILVEANARFDSRMLERIGKAGSKADWFDVRGVLLRAANHNNLRPEIRATFISLCPDGLDLPPAPAPALAPVPDVDLKPKARKRSTLRKPEVKAEGAVTLKQGSQRRAGGYVGLGSLQEAYSAHQA